MFEFYNEFLVPFGDCLTDMERNGIKVDVKGHLPHVELKATEDREKFVEQFKKWATKYSPDAIHMNVISDSQKQQLFFAPIMNSIDAKNKKMKEEEKRVLPVEKAFDRENTEGIIVEGMMGYISFD
jgi:DNA polymerase-1